MLATARRWARLAKKKRGFGLSWNGLPVRA